MTLVRSSYDRDITSELIYVDSYEWDIGCYVFCGTRMMQESTVFIMLESVSGKTLTGHCDFIKLLLPTGETIFDLKKDYSEI